MVFQKELWPTPEGVRREISNILANAISLDEIDEDDEDSKRVRLQFQEIPRVFDKLQEDPANDHILQKLDYVGNLTTFDEIGVAISDKKIDGRVGLFSLKIDDDLVSLVILVNEDVLPGLQSGDDRSDLIERFKQVFLQAADDHRRFVDERRFVPYSKV